MTQANPKAHRRTKKVTIMLLRSLLLNPQLAAGIVAITVCAGSPVARATVPRGSTTLVCTNSASHASWRIHIDFDNRTVDANPARIGAAKISWRDRTDGGHYTLDRKSGDLTVVFASSTGGYFLHDHCALVRLKPKS